jgi:hypothetical protein
MVFVVKIIVPSLVEFCRDRCAYYKGGTCTYVPGKSPPEWCRFRGEYIFKDVDER